MGNLPSLIVPMSAPLITGKRAVVYVRVPGADRPTFEGREVVLGPKTDEGYVVLDGLAAGDRVVTNGAFRIDSALQIQAKRSMMNPTGRGPAVFAKPLRIPLPIESKVTDKNAPNATR